jgi:hypothetical protein
MASRFELFVSPNKAVNRPMVMSITFRALSFSKIFKSVRGKRNRPAAACFHVPIRGDAYEGRPQYCMRVTAPNTLSRSSPIKITGVPSMFSRAFSG